MKTALTESQQQIIDAIVSEFGRVNSSRMVGNKFNLINVDSLISITNEIKRNKEEEASHNRFWYEARMNEANRIVDLLQQDLPMAFVERFGKSNGHYELPSVIIKRERGVCNRDYCVTFAVDAKYGECVEQSHGCYYRKIVGFCYKYYNTPNKSTEYNSVEELFRDSKITEEIRNKIIR